MSLVIITVHTAPTTNPIRMYFQNTMRKRIVKAAKNPIVMFLLLIIVLLYSVDTPIQWIVLRTAKRPKQYHDSADVQTLQTQKA